MPGKSRYWHNPEKHRAERRLRTARLATLGLPYSDQLSPAARAKRYDTQKKWHDTHKASNVRADKKYRKKLIRLFGTCGPRAKWRYHQLKEEQDAERRKAAIALLPRFVVESKRRFHLVSCRQMYRRCHFESWRMVLLGRNSKLQRPVQFARRSRSCTIIL